MKIASIRLINITETQKYHQEFKAQRHFIFVHILKVTVSLAQTLAYFPLLEGLISQS